MPRKVPIYSIPSSTVLQQLYRQQRNRNPVQPLVASTKAIDRKREADKLRERQLTIEPVTTKYFRLGHKEVHFPSQFVTLKRPHADDYDPYKATFEVPINFNKFDLRDYLHNIYKLTVKRVTSNIKYSAFKAQSYKYMTVEMDEPFVFPELPSDLSPWNVDFERERINFSEESSRRYGGSGPDNLVFSAYEGVAQNDFPTIKPFIPKKAERRLKNLAKVSEKLE
ncbi:hypothetical protein V1514DRAFT_331360 [Lipomyces japonicus]|uniref:mitochondrial 54S ribosomal protein uL23m n=1 Tax=Lipomyces japonicus TaxID=56871 RepID=UPI0034CD95CE